MNVQRILHKIIRPLFGICLFLSQFTSSRITFFTDNPWLLSAGVLVFIVGILLWIAASLNLNQAAKENKIAVSGPYKVIRHPVYTSIYVLSAGLGLMFFTWLWFIVMTAFIPLWYIECLNEEKEMIKLHGQEYINYRSRTGMFIPGSIKCF